MLKKPALQEKASTKLADYLIVVSGLKERGGGE